LYARDSPMIGVKEYVPFVSTKPSKAARLRVAASAWLNPRLSPS
jgi:hypothetical protein